MYASLFLKLQIKIIVIIWFFFRNVLQGLPKSTTKLKNKSSNTKANKTNCISDCPGVPTNQCRAAYIACTRRNQETISEFLKELDTQNLSYDLVYQITFDAETAVFGYNESHLPVKVYKITLWQKYQWIF